MLEGNGWKEKILTVLTRLTYSVEPEALDKANVAEAEEEDKAIKTVSLARKIARINHNACPRKSVSIAKTTTSASTVAALATLEVTVTHLVTLSAMSHRPRTTKRRPSRLEVIRTACIEARNDLTLEHLKLRSRTKSTTPTLPLKRRIPTKTTTTSSKNAPLNA